MPTREQMMVVWAMIRGAVARNWLKGAAVSALVACVAVLGTLVMPRAYYSEARLFVRFGRENQVDPTASGGQMVALYESRESEINSLIEILKSRAVLDRVVEELGLGGSAERGVRSAESSFRVQGSGFSGDETAEVRSQESEERMQSRAHQMAVMKLSKNVYIGAPRKSNIISVSCKASSPALAQKIVAKLVEVYREEHVRVHRSPGTYAFFEEQERQSLTAWEKAANELRGTKDRLGIVTIEGRRKHLDERLADINFKRLTNQADLKRSAATIASLEGQIAELPPTLITQETTGASAAADGMRQTLYTLEAQEHKLAAEMQDSHPRLIAARQQVKELREILDEQPTERVQATEAINPARQSLELSLLTERSRVESLVATEQALVTQQDQLRGEMTELNGQALTIDELTQRVALAENNHKEYSQRLEQARINKTLDDERISSLSLVQPASFVGTAAGPRRIYVLAAGMLVALGSGVLTILVFAWLNPVIYTAEQLSRSLNLPLAGSLPRGAWAA